MINEKYIELGKKRALNILKVFILLLLFFTFFSKSILGWVLPRVTVTNVDSGSLLKIVRGSGEVVSKERTEYYSELSTVVKSVNVKVFDKVEVGDVLVELDSDRYVELLNDRELDLRKAQLSLESIMLQKENLLLQPENALLESYNKTVKKNKEAYENNLSLYNEGAISESQYNTSKETYENAKEKYAIELENKSKSDQLQKNQVSSLDKQLEEKQLTIIGMEKAVSKLRNNIEQCTIIAETDGIIKALSYRDGMMVNYQSPIYVLDQTDAGFEVRAELNEETAKFIDIGDKFSVTVGELGDVIKGTVASKLESKNNGKKIIIIDVENKKLKGGEVVEVFNRKQYLSYDQRIPRGAIYSGSLSENVYELIEEDTPFGKSYTVKSVEVVLGESDDRNVGVLHGLSGDEKIVISSTRGLKDGEKVIINN